MPEHYTRSTTEVTAWCNTCRRQTRHAVSAGRRCHCLEHEPPQLTKRQQRAQEQRERDAQNPPLEFPQEGKQ